MSTSSKRYRGYTINEHGEELELYAADNEEIALHLYQRHGGLLTRVTDGAVWAGGNSQWIDDDGLSV
jgi:hypothetical protein